MDKNEINDIRTVKDFKGITFSKFKKSDARKELLKSLFNGSIEPACYWTAEFICAGHFVDVWNILLFFMSNNIHLGNPKLPLYMDLRFDFFKQILVNGFVNNEIRLRNNIKIRELFAEIVCILCLAKKKNSFDSITVDSKDFNMTNITTKLKADAIIYGKKSFMSNDPKELFIAINELAFHISKKSKNMLFACYWVEWILEFERVCKKKNECCKAERRAFIPVDSKYQKDVIWIIWQLLLAESMEKGKSINKIMKSLLNLFCIRFTVSSKRKKKFIIYFAISLLTDNVDVSIPLYSNEAAIESVKKKINIVYKQVKKNEISPQTSYLFNNSIVKETSNLKKTVQKLEKMSQLNQIFHRK